MSSPHISEGSRGEGSIANLVCSVLVVGERDCDSGTRRRDVLERCGGWQIEGGTELDSQLERVHRIHCTRGHRHRQQSEFSFDRKKKQQSPGAQE